MATIFPHKNNFFPQKSPIQSFHRQLTKGAHKLEVSSNIFANDYHIKEVHLISNDTILYETVKNNEKHIIHQVQINSQGSDSLQNLLQFISFVQQPYVDHVYIQTHLNSQNFSKLNWSQKVEEIGKILQSQEKVKCQIVLNSSVGLQQNLNQKIQKQDFVSVLNQFLTFLNSFHHSGKNLQGCLILRNLNTSNYVFHPLDMEISYSCHKSTTVALQTIIKHYLLINTAKCLKQMLNLRLKPTESILKLYETKHSNIQFSQFTSLLRETITNKQKFTQKMLICYIEILKQKYLKQKQDKQIFKHILNHQSIHQSPQKDFSFERRQKQSNSFTHPHQQKTKSLQKKLKINKQNDIAQENNYRRSDGLKSSSMISMSPNRKNRKYTKFTTASLFASKKEPLQRTSSTSFLTKTANSFNRNSSSSSFIDKNFYKTSISNTQSNFFKNKSDNDQSIPESQIKSYLQAMGFKSKGNDQMNKRSDSSCEVSKKWVQNQKIMQNPSLEASNVTESRLLSQSSFGRQEMNQNSETSNKNKKLSQLSVENPISRKDPIQHGSIISDADEKKLRLKQSLNLLQRKTFNANSFVSPNQFQNTEPQQYTFKKRTNERHDSIIPESEKTESQQRISSQQGPISRTVIHKGRPTDEIVYNRSMKFKIFKLNQMNIKIRGADKSKKLKIERSTVMVMHLVNLDRRFKTQSTTKSIQNERTSREREEEFRQREEAGERRTQKQVTFKPSLASVKKQKPIQKPIQKSQKPIANNSLSNRSILEQKNQKPIQEQYPANKSLNAQSQISKSNLQSQKQFSASMMEDNNLQTSYLTNSNTSGLSMAQNQNTSMTKQQQFQLSKQFFKQIFLFINSQNKTLVDLLESKLSYQIIFYAFYINYFKLNVTKSTTRQAIDKMWVQMKDYENKIKESQKISSDEKMLPQFEPIARKLLIVNMEVFVEKFWKKDELKNKEKENAQKVSDEVDRLTSGILKIAVKIIQANIADLRCNQKQLSILLKALNICATISQLIYSIQNKLITLPSTQLKKITQAALQNQSGYEKKWVQTIGSLQELVSTYNGWMKQAERDSSMKISAKNENKKIWMLLQSQ